MSELIIYNGKVYTEDGKIDNGYIHVKDGQIVAIGEVNDKAAIDNDTTNKIQVIDAKVIMYCQVLSIYIFMVVMVKMQWMDHMMV